MIRTATAADVPAIHRLVCELAEYEKARHEVEATPQQLSEALFGPNPTVFAHVAEAGSAETGSAQRGAGEVVGFALWFLNFSTWRGRNGIYLEDLYVRPEHRGSGLGRALLAELARICVERGYARLEWSVLDWNEPARGFYRSLGAVSMDEWTVFRLTGESLTRLGTAAGGDA